MATTIPGQSACYTNYGDSTFLRRSLDGHEAARGQILPLFAISLVALLALTGLGLDSARVMLERRQAQGAADLAAISGARSLPDDQPAALAAALEVAAANGYPSSQVTVTFPEVSKISVQVDNNIPMLFTAVVGVGDMDVGAHAAAVHTEEVVGGASVPLNGPAILAQETLCGKDGESVLKWTGGGTQDTDGDGNVDGSVINGLVVTNSGVDMSGTGNIMTGTYYDDPPACDNTVGVDKSPEAVFTADSIVGYPIDPLWDVFANPFAPGGICADDAGSAFPRVLLDSSDEIPAAYLTPETFDIPDGAGTITVSGNRITDGVYCRVDNAASPTALAPFINVKDNKICGHCTFIGETVQVGKKNRLESPALAVAPNATETDGVVCDVNAGDLGSGCGGYPMLVYATYTGSKALNWTGGGLWNGLLFTPFGHSFTSGHDGVTVDAAIWSNLVEISGDDISFNGPTEWGISGPGGSGAPERLALVE